MSKPISDEALDVLFRKARTYRAWLDKLVTDETLRQVYDLLKFAPTSANCSPARLLFLRTPEAKQRLVPALSPGNVEKTKTAPVIAIVAYDLKFYEQLTKLAPHSPALRDSFANSPQLAEHAFRNGSLQGAYLILAARAMGLDCGPMSGFDNAKVDQEFFSGTQLKSNFLCNIGYGDPATLYARAPRLDFNEACQLL